jgi:hypothetical protein
MVLVKAYPNASQKYGEVVCVAGVRTDTASPEWIRLWPIPFRDLEYAQRFSKYQIISVEAEPPGGSDRRPETMRPNIHTIELGEIVESHDNWARRSEYVLPLEIESMCELRRKQEQDGTSLGVFTPASAEMSVTQEDSTWSPKESSILEQPSLFFPDRKTLEKIPYRFRYDYRCADDECNGHHQTIIDWELAEAFRKWRQEYGVRGALDRIEEQWTTGLLFAPDRASRMFVGNMHAHPENFVVLGAFYPKRTLL